MRMIALTLIASGLMLASTYTVPVTGLATPLGEGIDPSAVFDTPSGKLAVAEQWDALTALTLQTDLRRAESAGGVDDATAPEAAGDPLNVYPSTLKDDKLLALSNEPPSASSTLTGLADEPFEPFFYVAAAMPVIFKRVPALNRTVKPAQADDSTSLNPPECASRGTF